ncbi:hypothetical protein X777_04549 [Ooceraea biroi]|uniref:Uncharacterized protein n=1 Tax=Ooceraea biroi TaxID=2015173 RepID=A0A026WG88_OOCBI|nr:hypothetical protein X777_04549 [Ooceraea biroi]
MGAAAFRSVHGLSERGQKTKKGVPSSSQQQQIATIIRNAEMKANAGYSIDSTL